MTYAEIIFFAQIIQKIIIISNNADAETEY